MSISLFHISPEDASVFAAIATGVLFKSRLPHCCLAACRAIVGKIVGVGYSNFKIGPVNARTIPRF